MIKHFKKIDNLKFIIFGILLSLLFGSCECNPKQPENIHTFDQNAFKAAQSDLKNYVESIVNHFDTTYQKGIENDSSSYDYWMKFLTSKKFNPFEGDYSYFNSLPDIKSILQRKVTKDETEIVLIPRFGATYGRASCYKGKPVILFTPNVVAVNNPYAFIFFREHEFAHHLLDHVDCIKVKYTENAEAELAADLKAAKILNSYGEEGRKIILIASGIFWEMGDEKVENYPTGTMRGNQLMAYYNSSIPN